MNMKRKSQKGKGQLHVRLCCSFEFASAKEMDITTELLRIYYEAVDSVVEALQRHFCKDDLEILEAIESCLLAAVNKEISSEEV